MPRDYPYTIIPMSQYRQIAQALEDAIDYVAGTEDDSDRRIGLQRQLELVLGGMEQTTLIVSQGEPL